MQFPVPTIPYIAQKNKIQSFDLVCRIIYDLRHDGWSVVLAQGVFDITHVGHRDYLRRSRLLLPGKTIVVVGVENDDAVRKNKGDSRPVNPLRDRIGMLSEWESVQLVFGYEDAPHYDRPNDFINRYKNLSPDYITVPDWDPYLKLKQWQAKQAGTKLAPLDVHYENSTTSMLKKLGYEH